MPSTESHTYMTQMLELSEGEIKITIKALMKGWTACNIEWAILAEKWKL